METKSNDYAHVRQVRIGFGQMAPHSTSTVKVEQLTALGEIPVELLNPVIHLNDCQLEVRGSIPSGHFLQYAGGDSAKLFDENWRQQGELPVKKADALIPHGSVTFSLSIEDPKPRPWLDVQVLTTSKAIQVGK
jgi:hypothetical protein